MIIETILRHGKQVFRDRILVSEVELLHAQDRAGIIQTARLVSYARILSRWRAYQKHKQPNE
jgi:hypothetical protein